MEIELKKKSKDERLGWLIPEVNLQKSRSKSITKKTKKNKVDWGAETGNEL